MSIPTLLSALGLCLFAAPGAAGPDAKSLADEYVNAVRELNEAHLRKQVARTEAELAEKMPKRALDAFEALLGLVREDVPEQLARCAEAALDLDRVSDFERVRAKLGALPAATLGIAVSRPRFLMRGQGGLQPAGLKAVADTLDAVLDAYDETFGFAEWSKVPGKKLRVRVHLVPKIEQPPHFAPQFPWHSEVDFPVVEADSFTSPTSDGKFLLYGLCHELGHVIAMWGDARNEEDHHAWAHYTGLAIVDYLSEKAKDETWMKSIRDSRWRSLSAARTEIAGKPPSLKDRDGVLSLLLALHDGVGPKAIGDAINFLDALDRRLRINRVRYYTFDELKTGLLATQKAAKTKQEVKALIETAAASK